MNYTHFYGTAYINWFKCVFCKKKGHNCYMPGMFCIVFAAGFIY